MNFSISKEQRDFAFNLAKRVVSGTDVLSESKASNRNPYGYNDSKLERVFAGLLGQVLVADAFNLERPSIKKGLIDVNDLGEWKDYDFLLNGKRIEVKTRRVKLDYPDFILTERELNRHWDYLIKINLNLEKWVASEQTLSRQEFLDLMQVKFFVWGKKGKNIEDYFYQKIKAKELFEYV